LRWQEQTPPTSSSLVPTVVWQIIGRYDRIHRRIIINASDDRLENRITLLHETAHHIAYLRTGFVFHDDRFWRLCWQIYLTYRIPLHAAVLSEFGYMAAAQRTLQTMGIRLSARARLAGELGTALRRDCWLQVRIQRLRVRLAAVSSPRKRLALRGRLRSLAANQRTSSRLMTAHARAYKRVARSL
jgi:hypothetical protein